MPIDEIKKVCFIGAGTMGIFNSLAAAVFGYDCVVYDISEEAVKLAPERQKEIGKMVVENSERLTSEMLKEGMKRISFTSDLNEAVTNVDLISESISENLELKRRIHRQLDEISPAHTIQTTNTSSLLVSEIEDVVQRGDKFAALHFHLGGTLADIVGGSRTAPETIDILVRFARSIAHTPIKLKKEKDGYIYNSILIAEIKIAIELVLDGHADFKDVDRSYMAVRKSPGGPFAWMDRIGINVIQEGAKEQAKRRNRADWERIVKFLEPFIERGDLGVKTKKGFYTYPNPEFETSDFLKG